MRMRSHFRRPQCEASKAPIGYARAYRDILNDALAALSIIRRARRLRTLLVRVAPRGFRPSVLDSFISRVCKGEGFDLRLGFVLCPVYLLKLLDFALRGSFGDRGCPGMSVECGCPGLRSLRWTPFLTVFVAPVEDTPKRIGALEVGESVCCPGSRSVAIAEGGLGPFFDRRHACARSPVAGGLGHAMFVGAVACDLSWREGRASVFGAQRGSREVFPVSIVSFGIQVAFLSVISCNGKRGTMKEQTMFAVFTQGRKGSN
ncbi:hypothetical protein CRG98_013448 [Punica granatum]|uniref:Uncharacterized protein n=1 Tax=Punica granatum TaxID=22663 RepID=A0A2I0KD52_PUNGR|nr:hypothetical protein CRG98_013448 [Punica granatum]